MANDKLVIFDTTLRDGEQSPGFSMNTEEKLVLARQLETLGVDIIEAGFPIASDDDAHAVALVAAEIRGPVIAALSRCNPADIERAGESLKPAARSRIHTFIATSDLHLERKLRITREQCLEALIAAVRQARGYTDDVEFSAEDATRTDMDFMCRVIETAIDNGATTINLPRHRRLFHAGGNRGVLHRGADPGTERRQGHIQRALPRRPGARGGKLAGGRQRRRAANRVHHQRHRRAGRQRLARRGRHGHPGARRPAAVRNGHPHQGAVPHEPAADGADPRAGAGEQGNRRPQRVRPRGGYPPGRRHQGPPHLRDHASRGYRSRVDAGARQALRPSRRQAAVRADRLRSHPLRAGSGLSCHHRPGRSPEAD